MNLLLHITVSETPPDFEFTFERWAKDNFKDLIFYSLDNHSDSMVIDTAVKAINKANKLLILIESDESEPLKIFKVLKAAHKIIGQQADQKELKILLKGNNAKLEVMAKKFGDRWHSTDKIKDSVTNFFKDQA